MVELLKNKLTAFFRGVDVDKNGFVERSDYEKITNNFADLRGWKPGSPDYENLQNRVLFLWEKYWVSVDLNKDSKVSLDEFLESCTTQFAVDNDSSTAAWFESMTALFDVIDMNGDEKIGPEEYKQFLKAFGFNVNGYEEIFQRLDANGDGYISKEEYLQLLEEFCGVDPEAAGNWFFGSY
ncbi:EF-hand domain-containing protein [Scytonema sp. UIC 10036]|uniref:EF-hand domain-containing protein n=1 Tax=Scytonema sp. UIC 10036 TaxID=2304196 RepID=UPI0012DADF69|nr:EF-hand domain-containing protein [Scytonema sp. UIC 10036]MUG99460.1 EF-hand domain-containing protein [Scytonema sp. UIC 10036]